MPGFLIRDANPDDLPACLALDHAYSTDRVWQMTVREDLDQYEISFKTERLPRLLEAIHPADIQRLRVCLAPDQCFLVAAERDGAQVLAYLTMRYQPIYHVAWVQDIVVDTDYRREGIGSRLLHIARRWAKEHEVVRLMVETRTTNYPMINFCTTNGLRFCGYNDRYLPNQDIAVYFSQALT